MSGEQSFPLPGARRQHGLSRGFDVQHIDLSLRPNLATQSMAGVCTLTVSAIDTPVTRLHLDAVDFNISNVTDGGGSLAFSHHDGSLSIKLRTALRVDERADIHVTYEVVRPQRGLYFRSSSNSVALDRRQCWTHGHVGGARYWFPCVDQPRQRQTSTMTIEVDSGYHALGNGALVERRDDAHCGTTVFRYEQNKAHASYLFTMVVGRFTEFAQRAGMVPVLAYAAPGREAAVARTFGKTPAMIEALERFTGAAYPFARYSQIAVADFPYIGMENTSAITFTDEWLLDAGAQATPAVEALVVHELAHQWFGNLVSSGEWTDVWLNEGFASYCEAVWDEAHSGWDAYAYAIFRQFRAYVKEADDKYTRPIVCAHYRDPIDLFDKHLYEKAGVLLHMLRGTLGESKFARVIARYVRENAGKSVETIDLIRAIEAETGRNLREFFDQWARRSGHPVITVAFKHDLETGLAQVRVTQHQAIDAVHPAYCFRLVIGVVRHLPQVSPRERGPSALPGERRISVNVDAAVTVYTFALDAPPALIRVDPGAFTLAEVELELGVELACAAIAHDPDPIARIRAAQALASDSSERAREALVTALRSDSFWGARAEFAAIIGEIGTSWAYSILLPLLADEEPSVRRAACIALRNHRGAALGAALYSLIASEEAHEVIGEALHTLGKARAARAVELCAGALAVASWRDVAGAGALRGLAEIGAERPVELIFEAFESEHANRRQSAIRALVLLAPQRPALRTKIIESLIGALTDSIAMTRLSAVEALGTLADVSAAEPLARMAKRESIPWIRTHADRAAMLLRPADGSRQ